MRLDWKNLVAVQPVPYRCGYCGMMVSSERGYASANQAYVIKICPSCTNPTYFRANERVPGVAPGNEVSGLPKDVEALYEESRKCVAVGSHTAAVLTCRKLLMHIAVEKKAKTGQDFLSYVKYLSDKGYVPPDGKGWVDLIRTQGNEANHEIVLKSIEQASELILFAEMLLKFIYEFPSKVSPVPIVNYIRTEIIEDFPIWALRAQ